MSSLVKSLTSPIKKIGKALKPIIKKLAPVMVIGAAMMAFGAFPAAGITGPSTGAALGGSAGVGITSGYGVAGVTNSVAGGFAGGLAPSAGSLASIDGGLVGAMGGRPSSGFLSSEAIAATSKAGTRIVNLGIESGESPGAISRGWGKIWDKMTGNNTFSRLFGSIKEFASDPSAWMEEHPNTLMFLGEMFTRYSNAQAAKSEGSGEREYYGTSYGYDQEGNYFDLAAGKMKPYNEEMVPIQAVANDDIVPKQVAEQTAGQAAGQSNQIAANTQNFQAPNATTANNARRANRSTAFAQINTEAADLIPANFRRLGA